MTNKQTAVAYGVIVASAIALILLIGQHPNALNLGIAIAAGIVVGIGSWFYLERRDY